jgi:hypothetical protein
MPPTRSRRRHRRREVRTRPSPRQPPERDTIRRSCHPAVRARLSAIACLRRRSHHRVGSLWIPCGSSPGSRFQPRRTMSSRSTEGVSRSSPVVRAHRGMHCRVRGGIEAIVSASARAGIAGSCVPLFGQAAAFVSDVPSSAPYSSSVAEAGVGRVRRTRRARPFEGPRADAHRSYGGINSESRRASSLTRSAS